MKSRLFIFLWVLSSCLFAQELSVNPTLEVVRANIGKTQISIEVARTPRELAQGLMFRDQLSDNAGMIFCLLQEERASFWMKNVKIPLSVAYMDRNGVILDILDMKPFDESPVWSRSNRVLYALEMNQGWFQLNKVKVGDQIKLEGRTLDSLKSGSAKKP
jgi:uncharacterized membrane protein (UPF0127 family)